MTRHVALLRGINVGGHNRVPMAELRAVVTALGFERVVSIIQSGNVCFDSREPADAIGDAIQRAVLEHFGVDAAVMVRTHAEVAATRRAHPFPLGDLEPKLHHIVFLAAPAPADAADRIGDHSPDEFVVVGSEIHIRYPEGSGRSKLTGTLIERRLDTVATARNLPTVDKIAAELASTASPTAEPRHPRSG